MTTKRSDQSQSYQDGGSNPVPAFTPYHPLEPLFM